jgi:hypothetical protein
MKHCLGQSQSQSHIATDGQSISKSWCRAISGAHDQIFITVWHLRLCFLWGALSDERTSLSFVYAAGPCQRSLSWVRVPWSLRSYFTVSDLRLPFSSPPTTHRVTVEIFDPASTRVTALVIPGISLYSLLTDHAQKTAYIVVAKCLPQRCIGASRRRSHRKCRASVVALRVFCRKVFNGQLPSNALSILITIWNCRQLLFK